MPTPLRVLVAEDSPDDAELMLLALSRGGFEPIAKRVETPEEMQAALAESRWDIVLSDYSMPGFGAADALAVCRATDQDLPFVVISGTIGEDRAVEMMRNGASDYFLKDNLARLVPAIDRELREADNRRARRRAEQAAAQLAAIVESSDDAIVSETLDGIVTSWNAAAERLLGWSAAEAIGKHISFVVPPDKADELDTLIKRLGRGESLHQFETIRLHRDGTRRDLSITMSPIRDGTGKLRGISKVARDITARKLTEAALRANEERYRRVVEDQTELVCRFRADGTFIFVNEVYCRVFGKRPEDLLGQKWHGVAHPDDLPMIEAKLMQMTPASPVVVIENRVFDGTGQVRWMEFVNRGVFDTEGNLAELQVVGRDITDRKRTQQDLKDSEERLRRQSYILQSVLDNMSDGVVVADPQGKFILFNPAAAEILNLGPIDAPPEEWSERYRLYLPDGKSPFPTADLPLIKAHKGESSDAVEIMVKQQGLPEPRWISVSARPMLDETGTLRGGIAVFRNVTEKKHAEQAVRQAQQRLRNVLASSPAMLYTLLIEGNQIRRISWISENLREMLDYAPDEALAADWWTSNVHAEDLERVMAQTREGLFRDGHSSSEYRFRHRQGGYRWVRSDIRLIRDAMDQPVEAVGSWSDITDRKRLEDQFHQAQKMEAFGQLAGGVAHDFNNLLTIINGYSDLLLQSLPAGDPTRELVAEILKAGERSAGLTRQLLAFSRQQVLAPRILDLNEVITETDKMLRRLIGEDVLLTTTLGSSLWAVRADPGQVEQVLLNLAVNARDAMPKGGRLTVETQNVELDETYCQAKADARVGRHVLLSVADTGNGMSPEVQARIFEPFFTTKGRGKGTGLGLATVFGIVKQSGGHIAVQSELGVGSTFKVYLPCVELAPEELETPSRILTPPHGTETILMAEDEAAVRALTKHILTDCGYTVLEAADGEEAVRLADAHDGPIQLLISDVVMPGMGGRTVADQVAQRRPGIRVLFMSGYTDDAVIRHGVLREGMNFLQKPFSPIALAYKVREVLDAPSKSDGG